MHSDDKKEQAYPRPSTEDSQQNHQTEFIDEKPNEVSDKKRSDLPEPSPDPRSDLSANEVKEKES